MVIDQQQRRQAGGAKGGGLSGRLSMGISRSSSSRRREKEEWRESNRGQIDEEHTCRPHARPHGSRRGSAVGIRSEAANAAFSRLSGMRSQRARARCHARGGPHPAMRALAADLT